jgi:alkylated DNA repair dioxygenase AlkB
MCDIEFDEVIDDNEIYTLKNSPLEIKFDEFWQSRPIVPQYCKIFGKVIEVPRNYAVFGETYDFAGHQNVGNKVIPCLEPFLQYGNSILVNWYEDGSKYIGYHSDDGREDLLAKYTDFHTEQSVNLNSSIKKPRTFII